jgi:hypothetical protein
MHIIVNEPGLAIAVPGVADAPMTVAVDGWGGYFGFKSILTGITGMLEGNIAWNPTALDLTYIYTFGDKLAQLSLAGLAFTDTCVAPGGQTGLEATLDFYMSNRAAIRARPSQIHVGAGVGGYFQGFLVGLRFGVEATNRLSEFQLTYNVVPRLRGAW